MKQVESFLDLAIQVWCNLVAFCAGVLIILIGGFLVLCSFAGGFVTVVNWFFWVVVIFTALFFIPRSINNRVIKPKIIYHELDDGSYLEEEIKA